MGIFGDSEFLKSEERIPLPKKKHLSENSRKKVIEGSLYIVFHSTREWYNFFEGKVSMEDIYYLCLGALINSVRYMVHCEKPVKDLKLFSNGKDKEVLEKPSQIFYRLKNQYYDVDYIRNISSDEFTRDYNLALKKLDEISRLVISMSFDIYGYRSLNNSEIADYLGIDSKRVSNIRRNAIKMLRKDKRLNMYIS